MAVTAYWYAKAFLSVFNKESDYDSNTMKNTLHSSSYTPNQDTHDYQNDLTNELPTANGYTAGGATGGSKTITTTNNVLTLDQADPAWTSSGAGFTARIRVLADTTPGSTSTNPLYMWMDFGQNETASGGGTFTIQESASGIGTITAGDATGFP